MKIYKVFKSSHKILAYVKISEDVCKMVSDTSYLALQIVRHNYNDDGINGTQLVDIDESLEAGVPIFTIIDENERR